MSSAATTVLHRGARASAVALILIVLPAAAFAAAQERGGTARAALPSIEEETAGLERIDGYLPLYWDESGGTLWLEIPRLDTEVLYVSGLAAGIGSNDIGLDRGQLGATRVVRFQRVGPKILMVQPNYRYRAVNGSPDEKRAVEESFGTSVIWGFTVAAASSGRVLVDATDFLMRDAHGVAARLRPAVFRLERSRSAVYMPRTKGFPRNTEMEVTLTFVADGSTAGAGGGFEGGALGAVVPSADAVTVRQHHSLVELPGPGFVPRRFDPRAGFGDVRLCRLLGAARAADDSAVHPQTPAPEEGPVGEGQRPGEADRLLPRPGRPGAVPVGAARRRAVVEPGVRGGRLPQRVPGRADAGGRRPDGRPLQRHPVGAPVHARLELRRQASPTRAPARSSRDTSRWARCACGRTT